MDRQQFGTIETEHGLANAMLCIDEDRPAEMVVTWSGEKIKPAGVLADFHWQGNTLHVKPRGLYKSYDNGGIYWPKKVPDAELDAMRGSQATLMKTPSGLDGEWTGIDGKKGHVHFNTVIDTRATLHVMQCDSWASFKDWATSIRAGNLGYWFRGHGCKSFPLDTTLNRLGRTRVERYCQQELQDFALHAQAVLKTRIDLYNPQDYSMVLGLARHHGVPTPLLDWTASPYIAAFFAFADALENIHTGRNSTHIRVFALTEKFVAASTNDIVVVPLARPYISSLTVAPLHNDRMYAQQGRFLVTNIADLESYIHWVESKVNELFLTAIDVPVSFAREALQDLSFMGLTAATMFPGLDGVGRMMRHQMSFKSPASIYDAVPQIAQDAAKGP